MDNRELALEDFLALKKKDSIESTCIFFQVDYRKSWSKKKMAEALAEDIRKDALKLFFVLPEEGLRFLSSLFRKKSRMGIEPGEKPYKPEDDEDFLDALDTLAGFGLIQMSEDSGGEGHYQITAPYELKKIMTPFLTKEMRQFSGTLDMMSEMVKGLLYYYGVVEVGTLIGMMREQVPTIPEDLCQIVVRVRAPIGGNIRFQKIDDKDYVFKARLIEMAFEGEREFDQALVRMIDDRPDLDYKAFSTEALIEASWDGFIENEEEYESLLDELYPYFIFEESGIDEDGLDFFDDDLSDEEFYLFIDYVMEEVRRTGDVSFALQILEANMDFPTKKARENAITHFRTFTNRISRYAFKGHTPLEMEGLRYGGKGKVIPFRKSDKIGRNDPCPCGSGKKYKNCHGRGQDPLN